MEDDECFLLKGGVRTSGCEEPEFKKNVSAKTSVLCADSWLKICSSYLSARQHTLLLSTHIGDKPFTIIVTSETIVFSTFLRFIAYKERRQLLVFWSIGDVVVIINERRSSY